MKQAFIQKYASLLVFASVSSCEIIVAYAAKRQYKKKIWFSLFLGSLANVVNPNNKPAIPMRNKEIE